MKSTILLCFLLEISLVLSSSGLRSNDKNLFEVASSEVTFRLYTRASPTNYIPLETGQLSGAALDATKPFKFIIHGYTDNAGLPWVIEMKDAYLTKGDYNVIAVDWSEPAAEVYSESAANTKDVGKFMAILITDLKNTLGVPLENVHLVGHSLGAQVSGFCGQYLLESLGATIARITGMDPAGPSFTGEPADSRLSPGDAGFVDIIHTDGGVLGLGYFDVCGDIDFYPNGGTPLQPGCLTRNVNRIDFTAGCSHIRSYMYQTESINSVGFVSKECDSYWKYLLGSCTNNQVAVMGENVDQNLRGVYYLRTNSRSPFAKNNAV